MKKKIIGIFVCMLMIVTVVIPTARTESSKVGFCVIPNDPDFSMQWYLNNTGIIGTLDADIDANEAWDIETGSSDVVIAILDTGVDYTHPDLAANIWKNADEIPNNGVDDDNNGYIDDVMGWDFAYDDNDPKDDYGHGTFCAGIASAVGNNGIGIAGVTWNCKIMNVKIFLEDGSIEMAWAANGIKYATDNGADVISMSWGEYIVSDLLEDAVNYAYDKGVFLCAAVGNENTGAESIPCAYEGVTAVAATDARDHKLGMSDHGEWVDIAAPGAGIYSTSTTYPAYGGYPQNYMSESGCSASTPMVAGVAALLLSIDPLLTPNEVKTLICGNVDPYISEKYIGTGRLNAQKAIAALILSQLPPNVPTITGEVNGAIETSYDFTIQTTDPEQHDVRYTIDWGDSTTTTTGLNASGKQIVVPHTWNAEGTYDIKVKAIDIYGAESGWATLTVTMPYLYSKSIPSFIDLLFQRFPNAFPLLRHMMGY